MTHPCLKKNLIVFLCDNHWATKFSPSVSSKMKPLWSFHGKEEALGQFYHCQLGRHQNLSSHDFTHCHIGIACSLLMAPPFIQKYSEHCVLAVKWVFLAAPSSLRPHSDCIGRIWPASGSPLVPNKWRVTHASHKKINVPFQCLYWSLFPCLPHTFADPIFL